MSEVDWKQVQTDDFRVPGHLSLADLTEELTVMLGDPDPARRDGTAYPTLATWVARGVYDDLLPGLGDGMVAGLAAGIGEVGTDSVFRRSFSALVLAECIRRDNERPLVLGGKVLQWGDAIATWLLREKDLRGFVPGKGWAHAVAHGADALAVLAGSPHLQQPELTVILDVIADRLLLPASEALTHGEPDRLVQPTLTVMRRGSVPHQRPGAVGQPDRRERLHLGVGRRGRRRPLVGRRQRPGVPALALPAARPRQPAADDAGRPHAGARRRAPLDEPPVPAPPLTAGLPSGGMSDTEAAPDAPATPDVPEGHLAGHAGVLAVAAARAHGVETMFTLSGAHVFPMYDGAVTADPPMRLLDVRHEQTAAFAAEATGKLTRVPGLAVLTAGPGVTNGVSAIAQAQFAGSPMVVVGGRAPQNRWGTGSLQELDQPPIVASVSKHAATLPTAGDVLGGMDEAFRLAGSSHRGPVFVDVPMDEFFATSSGPAPVGGPVRSADPDPDDVARIARLLAGASRPVVVLGTDVWADRAEEAALRFVESAGVPAITNGMGRGVVPGGHPLLVTKARGKALKEPDLVVVVGTPLDFRLGYGVFGEAQVVHVADSPGQVSSHASLAASASGDLTAFFDGLLAALERGSKPSWGPWVADLQDTVAAAAERDRALLTAEADPIHPARIYGELVPRLAEDSVVIGDGGDFVSFAGKFVEPKRPGGWLDPGPYGCLGAGLGAAIAARIARPSSQVVLLLGDGAAGFSLMDVDTLVRHDLPVVMVMGNNSAWGLEKGPMQMLYGYDVAADLAPRTAYDEVVRALGGAGETVTDPRDIGPAIDRAFDASVPYLVNVITDVDAAYPRSTFGI